MNNDTYYCECGVTVRLPKHSQLRFRPLAYRIEDHHRTDACRVFRAKASAVAAGLVKINGSDAAAMYKHGVQVTSLETGRSGLDPVRRYVRAEVAAVLQPYSGGWGRNSAMCAWQGVSSAMLRKAAVLRERAIENGPEAEAAWERLNEAIEAAYGLLGSNERSYEVRRAIVKRAWAGAL